MKKKKPWNRTTNRLIHAANDDLDLPLGQKSFLGDQFETVTGSSTSVKIDATGIESRNPFVDEFSISFVVPYLPVIAIFMNVI